MGIKHCNPKLIKEHFAGDEEMIEELVGVFASTYLGVIEELKGSVAENNFEVMERTAHTLKGMVANFFADDIKNIYFEIEKMSKEQSTDGIIGMIAQVESDTRELLDELRSL